MPIPLTDPSTQCRTYEVKIFVGTLENKTSGITPIWMLEDAIQNFVDKHKLCVSVIRNHYFYVGGNEPGIQVTLINYPRFPKEDVEIWKAAVLLAHILKKKAHQSRVTISDPYISTTIGEDLHPEYQDDAAKSR